MKDYFLEAKYELRLKLSLGFGLLWFRFGLGCANEWKMNESQCKSPQKGSNTNMYVCVCAHPIVPQG